MNISSEPFNFRVWTAFSRLIQKRYHRTIGFSPAMVADYLGKSYVENRNGDLTIPLFAGDQFLGAIRIKEGGTLSEATRLEIQGLFQRVGAALLEGSESLKQSNTPNSIRPVKISINLVGGGFESRQRLAIGIQEVLGSWALIPWDDAEISQWNTEDLEALSNISIYIRDIFELPPKERQHLVTLAQMPSAYRPHIIVGSYRPLKEYTEEKSMEDDVASLFEESQIFCDQMPKDAPRLKEALELLFSEEKSESVSSPNLN